MAFEVDFAGLEEIQTMLLKNADAAEKHAEPILMAGVNVMIKAQNAALSRHVRGGSEGKLRNSAGIKKPNKTKSGISAVVFPQGSQSHGNDRKGVRDKVRNVTIGAVMEFGTSTQPARPWLSEAEHVAADAVNAAMAEEWERVSDG